MKTELSSNLLKKQSTNELIKVELLSDPIKNEMPSIPITAEMYIDPTVDLLNSDPISAFMAAGAYEPCRVCGETSSSWRWGTATCESCKVKIFLLSK